MAEIKRKSDDLCLLCCKTAANEKGSHLVPAGLIKSMIGKRDYEEGYTIKPSSEKTPFQGFFGSANLKNSDPTIYPNEFVADYVFCTACEKRFSVVENEILPFLTQKYYAPNQTLNFPATDKGLYKAITGLRVPPKSLAVFLYGVAWRMSIQYWLQTNQKLFLPKDHHELIRVELDKVMDVNLKDFNKKAPMFPDWPYLLISCKDWKKHTENVVLPHPDYRNPYCFWMNEFIFIFSFAIENLIGFQGPREIESKINDGSCINQGNNSPTFIDISTLLWDKANDNIIRQSTGNFKEQRIVKLSKKLGISLEAANDKIHNLAKEFSMKSGKGFGICFDDAYKHLML